MKSFLLILISLLMGIAAFGQNSLPDSIIKRNIDSIVHKPPLGSINDLENIFTPREKQELDSLIKVVEKESKTEIVVLSLDTLPVKGISFDSTALFIAKEWWIGRRYHDRGVLIAFSKHMRNIRIENSFAIIKIISDAETSEIINTIIIPQFKQGKYFQGIEQGIIAFRNRIK
jgi:uncharacterized protein